MLTKPNRIIALASLSFLYFPAALGQSIVPDSRPIVLTVLPQDPGSIRTQSTVRENQFLISLVHPDGRKEVNMNVLTVEAQTKEYRIDAVSQDSISITRMLKRIVTRGKIVDVASGEVKESAFDSDRPIERGLLKDSKEIVDLLKIREVVVFNSDGSTRQYRAEGPNAALNAAWESLAEREREKGDALFADHPVKLNENWPMGTVELSGFRFGVLTRDIEGKLLKIVIGTLPRLGANEKAVVIEVRGTNVGHRPDPDSAAAQLAKVHISHYEEKGQLLFSLDRKEIVSDHRQMTLGIEVSSPSERHSPKLLMTITHRLSKGRGTIEEVSKDMR